MEKATVVQGTIHVMGSWAKCPEKQGREAMMEQEAEKGIFKQGSNVDTLDDGGPPCYRDRVTVSGKRSDT